MTTPNFYYRETLYWYGTRECAQGFAISEDDAVALMKRMTRATLEGSVALYAIKRNIQPRERKTLYLRIDIEDPFGHPVASATYHYGNKSFAMNEFQPEKYPIHEQ